MNLYEAPPPQNLLLGRTRAGRVLRSDAAASLGMAGVFGLLRYSGRQLRPARKALRYRVSDDCRVCHLGVCSDPGTSNADSAPLETDIPLETDMDSSGAFCVVAVV